MTSSTQDRILREFLRLLAERGFDATTTRLLAEEAGVNEVTVFRLFGDKANLASEAFRRFAPVEQFANYTVAIDTSSNERVVDGILDVLNVLRRGMLEHVALVEFNMAEYWRLPQLKDQLATIPRAARELVERALDNAAPRLRPDLDRRRASLSLIGLLLVSVIWQTRGWIELSDAEWDATARQAVQGLLR
ncbi:MAG: TetR/AcrR family transcriptional regulator [Chloroflexi bacterium]|nr:TetR/AcrR family transcriptional regulator [Chloroflexota bacterium]MBV9601299.1 TetR/AcrR family transcriptional regulator [Chloroflexota bacterium]